MTLLERLFRLVPLLLRNGGKAEHAEQEEPLKAELFSADQLEHHGRMLAAIHTLGTKRSRDSLLSRLARNESILLKACARLMDAIRAERPITPAAEWLLDNFYLIEEQVRAAKRHLPKQYSAELPPLARGPSAGQPRVYDIALQIISHGDGRVDPESLAGFVAAYQTVTPLNLGELWAIPIMLRLALIENLRRVASRIAAAGGGRDLADFWADQMIAIAERDPKSLVLVIADMARSNPPTSSAFVAELVRRLQGQSPALALALTWVEQRLAESGLTIAQLVQAERQRQAADQASIANSIGSLRFLAVRDWRDFVETSSIADRTLREDPAGVYKHMDFATRDLYRHALERIAKRSNRSEVEVARMAVHLATSSVSRNPGDLRHAHVGYYLIGSGLPQMERLAGTRMLRKEAFLFFGEGHRLWLYLSSIAFVTVFVAAALLNQARAAGTRSWLLLLCGAVALICTSHLAVQMVNWVATLFAKPRPLPRMDYQGGIPAEARTLVVVPALLVSMGDIEGLIEALEIRFLANQERHLHFALLTDFTDARDRTEPSDTSLLEFAAKRIDDLNRKHGDVSEDLFFLFHRPRQYSHGERAWIGFERKRGKLSDLNALLRGAGQDRFSRIVGNAEVLSQVKYVITLDSDTQLPRDAARELVGAMMHPLNNPRYDIAKRRVVEGYGILQPRLAAILPDSNPSRYTQLYGGDAGIDPYTRTVSDVYQDLFGEGSFVGKGIYDVDMFEQALRGRFPDNRILSHDLLEGCYARCGLITDVQVYESDPPNYRFDMRRRHRWIRGDWQIASWLLPWVPSADRQHEPNPLSVLSQWKLLDNLRRSLVPPALTGLLLLGWTVLSPAGFWTTVVIGVVAIPVLAATMVELLEKSPDALLSQHLRGALLAARKRLLQALVGLAFLPYETFSNLDAIVRTTVRTLVTHRHLLQWTRSDESERDTDSGVAASYRSMWFAPLLAATTTLLILYRDPGPLAYAAPLLALWFASPALAWWLDRSRTQLKPSLGPVQVAFLHLLARRTWAFFENAVRADENWLPPDNIHETSNPIIAHRTSPTNIGLSLLATLAAHDFGFLSTGALLARTANALASMQKMERYRGHFFNWYDTRTLEPLRPRYVSTVDSGNLVGSLLTLRPGLVALAEQPIFSERWVDGFADTLAVLRTVTDVHVLSLDRLEQEFARVSANRPRTLEEARQCLVLLLATVAETIESAKADSVHEGLIWLRALKRHCEEALDDITLLAPWSALSVHPNGFPVDLGFTTIPTLREIASFNVELLPLAKCALVPSGIVADQEWLQKLENVVRQAIARANERLAMIERLALQVGQLTTLEYDFLYDSSRRLMSIGYNVSEHRRDPSYYDLLASEARLCTFVGIAQGQLPQESWFALGRLLTYAAGEPILLSWSGSMFEYLMPLLVMPTFANTLLDQTARAAVKRQIQYGTQRDVPWGISECGYNTVDAALNYQYRAFGVPGLGLQRGLAEDLVIAPYASALALMVDPRRACSNLQHMATSGCMGAFGFYEAIDFTSSRLRRGESSSIVREYMAHHQGMTLLSIAFELLDRPMQKRFVSEPALQATLLLLQERVPKARAQYSNKPELVDLRPTPDATDLPVRVFTTPDTQIPAVQLLSNGRYHVMVTNSGGGFSRWRDLAVTRWREDGTGDSWGTFCYLRDCDSGSVWSPAFVPTRTPSSSFEAIFTESRVEFRRRDVGFETHTEIVVSPEDDVEIRRIRITNEARVRRSIDVVSYAEVVLASPAADALHPAFSNLFVQTEIVRAQQALICTRRLRSQHDQIPSLLHLVAVHGADVGEASYETDRAQFIGRGNSVGDPQALRNPRALSGSQGSVLDPIVAIRQRVTLDPEQMATVDFVFGIGENRSACLGLIGKYQDRRLADRAFEMAWTHSQVAMRQLNITEADAQLYGRLSSSIVYANASLRADASAITRNRRGQAGLWGYAISGDLPIVLLQIKDIDHMGLVRQLVQAHAYWRMKGLVVDLVIWNEERGGYRQMLQDQIMGLIAAGVESNLVDRPGGIFVRAVDNISTEDRTLLQSVARAIFVGDQGTLADQIKRRAPREVTIQPLAVSPVRITDRLRATVNPVRPPLEMDNGLGGFSMDGREYVTIMAEGSVTPAPWVNVVANPKFGSLISESGPTYTWNENAHEFRLTPWHNDPVTDASGEAFYIRDEESGHFWSPTPLPRRGKGSYTCRHGFGYSVFEHSEDGISTELVIYVALETAVKFTVLRVRNTSGRTRRLSATGYLEWVLGDLRPKTSMHVVTEIDPESGAVFARNAYNLEFADSVAFFDVDDVTRTISGDRTEFVGRNGTLKDPAALGRAHLSGRVGAAMDPCAAIQIPFELADSRSREIIFRMGVGRGKDEASRLVLQNRKSGTAGAELEAVNAYWSKTLGTIQVTTPDKSINVLTNGWLLYQTLACRMWARSGYYQSGGAFGFRDQLQDAMALVHAAPRLMREHLLLCASRQFVQGDVQHWWHPPSGHGVRSRCSDDFLWLPLATCRYIGCTGDSAVLTEEIPFLEGRPLAADEESYYDLPLRSGEHASLYKHCVLAIERGLAFGKHGLPLIGSGDWNDGMNNVGLRGMGESVWLGFFLYAVLTEFSTLAQQTGDATFAQHCDNEARKLRANVERHGWDGDWYCRAFFDDGTPLGSVHSPECKIDSIAQSWSVLSRAGPPDRTRRAMGSVYDRLVQRDHALVKLLTPPFDKSTLDPGYIRGYAPGIRENGGQYTHAAIWAAMAFAALGDAARAWELVAMINPIDRGNSPGGIATYRGEPYVVAGDVYAVEPHIGRAGWTWYTGSAGWMYRLIVESLLGIHREGNCVRFAPCLPATWDHFEIVYRYGPNLYRINVRQGAKADGAVSVSVDGVAQPQPLVSLTEENLDRVVEVAVCVARRTDANGAAIHRDSFSESIVNNGSTFQPEP